MSKLKATSTLLGWVESDDEDSDILSSGHKPVRRMVPPKKPVTATATRLAAAARTTTTTTKTTTRQPTTAATRKALAEKPANVPEKTMAPRGRKRAAPEEAPEPLAGQDENAIERNAKPKATRGRPRAAKAAKVAPAETEGDDEVPEAQPEPKPKTKAAAAAQQPPAKRGRKPKAKAETEREIPETQHQEQEPEIPETQQQEQLEATELSVEEEDDEDEIIEPPPAFNNRAGMSSAQRPTSQQNFFGASHRSVPGSASKLNDPLMKRRMGDLTRKYQELEARYQDLREIGVLEAERNYDRLKQQSEEKSKTANELIATLKAQVAAQTEVSKESQRLRQQLEASQAKADELQNQLADANMALAGAKTENKTLSTKLGAARSAEQASVKVPGSAIKGNTADKRLLANAETAVQQAQMKEDLYADLTGLIVRGIKREKDEDIYDCLQTGRNGTLHFKLSVGADGASAENFDESQFVYMPQLDPNRDEALVDVLPDYLQEEITFPRPQAAKFYARVMKSLTERIID